MASAGRPLYKQVPEFLRTRIERLEEIFLFRKNYTFLGVVFASAFAFEIGFDNFSDKIWDKINKGRQWKDIRAKYIEGGDDDE